MSAESEMGKSGRSTSISMVADCALWPEAERPLAVSMYFLEAMLVGIASENWAGTDVAISVIPRGGLSQHGDLSESNVGRRRDRDRYGLPGIHDGSVGWRGNLKRRRVLWHGRQSRRREKKENNGGLGKHNPWKASFLHVGHVGHGLPLRLTTSVGHQTSCLDFRTLSSHNVGRDIRSRPAQGENCLLEAPIEETRHHVSQGCDQ